VVSGDMAFLWTTKLRSVEARWLDHSILPKCKVILFAAITVTSDEFMTFSTVCYRWGLNAIDPDVHDRGRVEICCGFSFSLRFSESILLWNQKAAMKFDTEAIPLSQSIWRISPGFQLEIVNNIPTILQPRAWHTRDCSSGFIFSRVRLAFSDFTDAISLTCLLS
jgi:hypothetical protein